MIFPGAIYDKPTVEALRFYASLYIHGHTVGGTNPSLVEALGAGIPILSHANKYNSWVIGNAGRLFFDVDSIDENLDLLLSNNNLLNEMSIQSRMRYEEAFTWAAILAEYENLLEKWLI